MATEPKPELLLGKETTPEALDAAAIEFASAAYRQQHGVDPTPEMLTAARSRLAARRSSGSSPERG